MMSIAVSLSGGGESHYPVWSIALPHLLIPDG